MLCENHFFAWKNVKPTQMAMWLIWCNHKYWAAPMNFISIRKTRHAHSFLECNTFLNWCYGRLTYHQFGPCLRSNFLDWWPDVHCTRHLETEILMHIVYSNGTCIYDTNAKLKDNQMKHVFHVLRRHSKQTFSIQSSLQRAQIKIHTPVYANVYCLQQQWMAVNFVSHLLIKIGSVADTIDAIES